MSLPSSALSTSPRARARRRRAWLLVVAVALAASSCAPLSPRYYVASYRQTSRALVEPPAAPTAEARELVRAATTVAFVPPAASCADEALCAVYLADLEQEAAKSGFEVVSWRALVGPSPPIEYAREHGVDVLFEINELAFELPAAERYRLESVELLERETRDDGAARQIVSGDVEGMRARCRQRYWEVAPLPAAAILDVKVVSVANGRVARQLRATRIDPEEAPAAVVERTWEVSPQESDISTWTLIVGGSALIGGIVLALVPLIADEPGSSPLTSPLFLAGLEITALGALVMASSFVLDPLFATYPPPDEAICRQGAPPLEERALAAPSLMEARRRAVWRLVVRDVLDEALTREQQEQAEQP